MTERTKTSKCQRFLTFKSYLVFIFTRSCGPLLVQLKREKIIKLKILARGCAHQCTVKVKASKGLFLNVSHSYFSNASNKGKVIIISRLTVVLTAAAFTTWLIVAL